MNVKVQKRLAAEILGCGIHRVWVDPDEDERVSMAITRVDIRNLIKNDVIKKKPKASTSRGRARELHKKRKLGRRRGSGKRKGKKTARLNKKRAWINKIRPLRRKLKELKEHKKLDPTYYRKLYKMAGSGAFRNVSHMESYITDHGYAER
ncbi:MAG: 50S ribosomal protein L19e [Euryarchaeota archaeon]|nr:50S ribosomal protein L19e [Euryarchaeota archaeon]